MKKSSSGGIEDEIIDVSEVEGRNHHRNLNIMERVVSGDKYVDIARDFHLTPAAISAIALKNGFVKRPEVAYRQ